MKWVSNFTHNIGKKLDSYLENYNNSLVVGDFNSKIIEISMHKFCSIYNLRNLCDKASCYKNPENPSCIDLFLTNSRFFQSTQTTEIGLSDYHRLVVTVLKIYLPNDQPKIITYRDYEIFYMKCCLEEFQLELVAKNVDIFQNVYINVLHVDSPEKQKYVSATQANFMDTELNHVTMVRSQLRHKYL